MGAGAALGAMVGSSSGFGVGAAVTGGGAGISAAGGGVLVAADSAVSGVCLRTAVFLITGVAGAGGGVLPVGVLVAVLEVFDLGVPGVFLAMRSIPTA
jgi:hypothetical protein